MLPITKIEIKIKLIANNLKFVGIAKLRYHTNPKNNGFENLAKDINLIF